MFTGITHNSVNSELSIQEELRALEAISDVHFLRVQPDLSSLCGHPHCLSTSGAGGILGRFLTDSGIEEMALECEPLTTDLLSAAPSWSI